MLVTSPFVAAPSRAAVPWQATASRWLRRAHLWSGLAMLPFVLLYGISAFLFNHAGGAVTASIALPSVAVAVDAGALAAAIAPTLQQDPGGVADARLAGEWAFECGIAGVRHRVTLPADGAPPTLRALPPAAPRSERVPAEVLAAANERAAASASAALAAAGLTADGLRRTGAPTLRYVLGDRETSVSLERGQATARAHGFDLERLLMRLHTAHGYAGSVPRVVWAVVVDLTAACMSLWALSGIVMWWQRRSHRRAGLFLLAGAFAACALLAWLLHAAFAR